jgi:hypothetical protein
VWCWVHGDWPDYGLYHLDGDHENNRIDNLVQSHGRHALKRGRRAAA